MTDNNIIFIILAIITGFLITFYFIPVIINVGRLKGIIDSPDEDRKIHREKIPTLGGVAIFGGILIGWALWIGPVTPGYFPYMIASLMILFATGIKDDILLVSARNKLLAQIIAAASVVVGGNIRLHHFDGFLGLEQPTFITGTIFTIFAIVVIINAFNFIDGIDGLAGSITLVASVAFGIIFFVNGQYPEALLAFVMAGSIAGFLIHNFEPAKIFMGDTGALIIGFIMAVLAFRMIELNSSAQVIFLRRPSGVAFSILIIPLFDTLRVIIMRLARGRSPFRPDNQHVHHYLLRMGFRHKHIAIILAVFTIFITIVAFAINDWALHFYLPAILLLSAMLLPGLKLARQLFAKSRKPL